ncbi:hypothetical protein JCM33374_g3078 [Metschnikowia sp. JCM 33374]|nr:hypothetical protein JCM33374_g3078 [Metschnikowia sp. JCM 33374]
MTKETWRPKRSHDNFSPDECAEVNPYYKYRPILQIPGSEYTNGPQVSIMTYNLYHPQEEVDYDASKYTREQILLFEIARYNPDIICLQEVDDHYRWIERFAMFGYNMRVANTNKFHSLAICYKWELFEEFDHKSISFWSFGTGDVRETFVTSQGALFVCLRFKPDFLKGHKPPSRDALIVGTTHLPSTKIKMFGRTRDTAILLHAIEQFAKSIRNLCEAPYRFYTFVAGDFNSTVDDAAYLSLVSKPVEFCGRTHRNLIRSIINDQRDQLDEKDSSKVTNEKSMKAIADLEKLHNGINRRAISLYSIGYRLVHPENSHPLRNEPTFSYCGKKSQSLIDYIFVVAEWDGSAYTKVDSLERFSWLTQMQLLALLDMPTVTSMCLKTGQPRVGEYPSDHLCMMADLELL